MTISVWKLESILNNHFWNANDNFKMKKFRFAKSDEFSIGGYFVFEERNGIMMRPVWKLALEENESVARWILV